MEASTLFQELCGSSQTCSVARVYRPWSPQLECQSVPVEQSSRQTQPRECKAQAPSQEIALENTPVWRLIIREGGKKNNLALFSVAALQRKDAVCSLHQTGPSFIERHQTRR